ncbi:VanZ family protein [Floricoccus tropicus]
MKSIKYLISLILSFVTSYVVVGYLAYPTLLSYPRLERTMGRFPYTKETLILFLAMGLFLAYIQWDLRKISIVYIYLACTVYLFLLFVVLFTKAESYHALSLDLFDFLKLNEKDIREALLNVLYFIPLGIIYGFRASRLEFVFISLLTILGIETIQYVFYLGTFGLSDIMLNFIGTTIGYYMCKKSEPHFS